MTITSGKDPKHTRDQKNAFKLDETGQHVQIFRGSPLFQATYNIKTEKQTISSTYLVSVGCGSELIQLALCQLDVGVQDKLN